MSLSCWQTSVCIHIALLFCESQLFLIEIVQVRNVGISMSHDGANRIVILSATLKNSLFQILLLGEYLSGGYRSSRR